MLKLIRQHPRRKTTQPEIPIKFFLGADHLADLSLIQDIPLIEPLYKRCDITQNKTMSHHQ